MPSWDSGQYLQFAKERTQPALDLAARVTLAEPSRVIDLGCGPGNSTAVLRERWPKAALTGLDNSPAMLAAARKLLPDASWIESDITSWASRAADHGYDLVFSNAALQWVPHHGALLPRLMEAVSPGGALAFQVPHSLQSPHQGIIRDLALSSTWKSRFVQQPGSWHVESPHFYYDALAGHTSRVEVWRTEYVHVLEGPEAIVEWYRGTGLRPFLEQLPDESSRAGFLRDYLVAVTSAYPRQPNGRVLMPFPRLFVIAYR